MNGLVAARPQLVMQHLNSDKENLEANYPNLRAN